MSRPRKLERYFGKCRVKGCKTRRVIDGAPYVGQGWQAVPIFYTGRNGAELQSHGIWCAEHNTYLKFDQLAGTFNPEKVCDGRCMGAVGPACDCSCGGENHGAGHAAA